MSFDPEVLKRLEKLQEKYASMGQDLLSYLDGLLYADYLTYWDYIKIDTLLSLQSPRTPFKDEMIFILYHQITELYFKLSLHEFEQIAEHDINDTAFFIRRIDRINSYFRNLTHSFEIMIEGMEKEQFLKFRMSLLPASGFQSAQYRMVEICSTDLIRLVHKDKRAEFESLSDPDMQEMFANLYWKQGATELATGKKTLTLKQFEEKYSEQLIDLAEKYKYKNLRAVYHSMNDEQKSNEKLITALRQLDVNVNVNWPLVHYKSAVRYLQMDPESISATGGTNWQKYLPPRFQKRIFYPELWSEKEIEEWGKAWVESVLRQLDD